MCFRRLALATAIAASLTACGGVVDPSKNQTQEFSGTVPVGAAGPSHDFRVSKNGEYTATITGLTPNSVVFIGVLVGQPTSAGCTNTGPFGTGANQSSQLNRPALNGFINKGDYCLQLFDPGNLLPTTASYTVTVSHP